jgi:hypothetical protein
MHYFMCEDATEFRSSESVYEVRVMEQRDTIGRHGLDRTRLSTLESEEKRSEKWMIQKKGRSRLLDANGLGCLRSDHAAAASMYADM